MNYRAFLAMVVAANLILLGTTQTSAQEVKPIQQRSSDKLDDIPPDIPATKLQDQDVDDIPPDIPATPSPRTHERLHATLWIQTSLEHRMACRQIFELASLKILQHSTEDGFSAAIEQANSSGDLPLAVILDIDETVLDNSPFQARIIEADSDYSEKAWVSWVEEAKATAIPGAKEFVHFAIENGIEVIFVTNRTAEMQAKTITNLESVLGIEIAEDSIHCKGEQPGWGSNKTSRREHVCQSHRVIALVGDDYNDFAWVGKSSPEDRIAIGQQFSKRWGNGWYLIPNPLYGNWEKAIFNYDYDTNREESLKLKYERLQSAKE